MSVTAWAAGLAAAVVAFACTPIVARVAMRFGVVDRPLLPRKTHRGYVPLMGGAALWAAVSVVLVVVLWRTDALTIGEVTASHYIGIIAAGAVLLVGGLVDDRFNLSPRWQFVAPVLAALIAIVGGVGIEKITNPFGGAIWLETQSWGPFQWPGDVFVFAWLIGMMFTTKLLDGLDGLATSVGSVGALMVLLLASSTAFFQPDVVVLAAIVLGAFLGFLVWNVSPARVFLGESGALLVGFYLGVLAIISGGKIATLLLVMGVPILDVAWVMVRRVRSGRAIVKGDRFHLHHRLLDAGWSQGYIVLMYTVVAAAFGALTLVLSSMAKLVALGMLAIVMFSGAAVLLMIKTRGPLTRGPQRKGMDITP